MAALGLVACRDDREEAKRPEPAISTQRLEIPSERIAVTTAELVSPAKPLGPLDDVTRQQLLDAVRAVFTATVADPLVKGLAGEIAPLFTPEALATAVGADRGVVYDEGLGTVETLLVPKGEVRLRALEHEGGAPALVVASIDWQVASKDGRVAVHRVGDLTFVARDNHWVVESYTLVVSRQVGQASATTTTARSS